MQEDIRALIQQSEADIAAGIPGLVPIAGATSTDERFPIDLLQSVQANVAWNMSQNRKVGALKQLQVRTYPAAAGRHCCNIGAQRGGGEQMLFAMANAAARSDCVQNPLTAVCSRAGILVCVGRLGL